MEVDKELKKRELQEDGEWDGVGERPVSPIPPGFPNNSTVLENVQVEKNPKLKDDELWEMEDREREEIRGNLLMEEEEVDWEEEYGKRPLEDDDGESEEKEDGESEEEDGDLEEEGGESDEEWEPKPKAKSKPKAKRTKKQKLDCPNPKAKRIKKQELNGPNPKAKRIKKQNLNGPNPPPDMPDNLRRHIVETMGGTGLVLVIQKPLFHSDVNPSASRFLIPFSQITPHNFLNETEIEALDNRNSMQVSLLDPSMRQTTHTFKTWFMNTAQLYALTKPWNDVVKNNRLEKDDIVQLWAFRVDSNLSFALVKLDVQPAAD